MARLREMPDKLIVRGIPFRMLNLTVISHQASIAAKRKNTVCCCSICLDYRKAQ